MSDTPLQPSALAGQFVLTQEQARVPAGWATRQASGWTLATHPALPVAEIAAPEQARAGWLVGYPIAGDELGPPAWRLPPGALASAAALEQALAELGGRFVAIVLAGPLARLYLDACGSLAAVYSTQAPVVASTPSLIGGREHAWDDELARFLQMPASGRWYPFGLTPRRNVERLLPNHYLDLASWSAHRHWAGPAIEAGEQPVPALVETIVSRTQRNIAAAAQRYPLHLSLTAGRDSRMLLACARAQTERIVFFTFTRGRDTADAQIARTLARRHQLAHRQLRLETAQPAELAAWLERTGRCVSGEIWKIHPTLRHLDRERALLPGMAGEVARAYLWRAGDHANQRLEPAELLARCHLPANEPMLLRARAWLDELAGLSAYTILDLLYLEQRLGCWGGPQQYGGDGYSACQLFPLAHREIFAAMLALPPEYRRENQLALDICRLAWPELLDLPFNQFSGWQRYPRRVAKALVLAGRRALAALRA